MNSKYRAKRCTVDGLTFSSKAEAHRYKQLKMLLFANEIDNLVLQPKYVLQASETDPATGAKIREVSYYGDFQYTDKRTGETICEDVKGFETPVFRLKWALVRPRYPNVRFVTLQTKDFY